MYDSIQYDLSVVCLHQHARKEQMCSYEAVFSPQVCPVTVQISLSQCVHRMDALTPVPASLDVWVSKTISLSLDLVSPRIPVILTSVLKAKGRL